MTALAWVALLGVAVVLYILWRKYKDDLVPTTWSPATDMPDNWGEGPDDDQWDDDATNLKHSALKDTRELAGKWGATIAGLLGVFGIVVFAKGPTALTDVPGGAAYVVLVLVILATLTAGVAIYYGALAAQGTPGVVEDLDGWSLKQLSLALLPVAVSRLKTSRFLALVAGTLILGAVVVAWLATLHHRSAETPTSVLATFNDGTVACGKLVRSDGKLNVMDGTVKREMKDVKQVASVSSCPK